MLNFERFIYMYYSTLKNNYLITLRNPFLFFLKIFCFLISSVCYAQVSQINQNKITYSFFAETGETEDSFTIAGRNFPVKVGSVGLKANFQPHKNFYLYSRAGIGYSPKQNVSAFNFNVSGSVFATSIGAGASGEYRIRKSDFVIVPFLDYNLL